MTWHGLSSRTGRPTAALRRRCMGVPGRTALLEWRRLAADEKAPRPDFRSGDRAWNSYPRRLRLHRVRVLQPEAFRGGWRIERKDRFQHRGRVRLSAKHDVLQPDL